MEKRASKEEKKSANKKSVTLFFSRAIGKIDWGMHWRHLRI